MDSCIVAEYTPEMKGIGLCGLEIMKGDFLNDKSWILLHISEVYHVNRKRCMSRLAVASPTVEVWDRAPSQIWDLKPSATP